MLFGKILPLKGSMTVVVIVIVVLTVELIVVMVKITVGLEIFRMLLLRE